MTHQLAQTAAIDFFTVPTATFRIFFVLVVLSHHQRRVLHFGVSEHSRQEWTMQHATAKMQFPSAFSLALDPLQLVARGRRSGYVLWST